MKFKLILSLFLLTAALPAFAADTTTLTITNTPVAASNVTVVVITNKLDAPPKELEAVFTNSADMVLLKFSDTMWVGKYEVTQKEYQKITGDNPSAFGGDNRPVDSLSWNDAMEFCKRMTDADTKEKKIPVGFSYSLPTEDEWQSFVDDATVDDAVTSLGADRNSTSPVGTLKPNSLGLYDIRGNVMEFCLGDTSKPYRVLLGGSWQDSIEINLRPVFRHYTEPDKRENTFGFRCVLKKH